jgi:glycosyltransferase involved in cell wall biosynthesis
MRIALISTFDQKGGAGIAALRLMRGLSALGHECGMLVKEKTSAAPEVRQLRLETSHPAHLQRRAAEVIQKYCINRNRTPISNSFFSLGIPGYDLSGDAEALSADVIHLHWVSNLLSPSAIGRLQQLGKPVVWTLHDQRAFTGGCHYSAGCRGYEKGCETCPQLQDQRLRITETALQESLRCIAANLTIVCPSGWMADCARASTLLRHSRIETIPNGIDTGVFKPHRAEARKALGLENGRIYLLAGADVGSERRKGFHLLARALKQVFESCPAETRNRLGLLAFGEQTLPEGSLPCRTLGRVDSESGLAGVYAACDAFLLPSLEDNLPNTMVEAICCGTPVIGFATGGVAEAIEHGKSGLVVAAGDTEGLAREILRFLADARLRETLQSGCETQGTRYSLPLQARRHEALYQTLVPPQPGEVRHPSREVHPVAPLGEPMAQAFPMLLQDARMQRWRRRIRNLMPSRPEKPLTDA